MKQITTLSITSGKGGVGKTTVVANLAAALAQAGQRVLILDGDLGMANIEILFGAKSEGNLFEVLKGEKAISEVITPLMPNVSLIPGGSGIVELNRLSNFERKGIIDSVGALEHQFDYLLIDTAPGISDNVLHLNAAAQEVVVVITPDAASLADSYALIKILNKEFSEKHFSIITNQVKNEQEGLTLFNRFDEIVSRFLFVGLNYLGSIPSDPQFRKVVSGNRIIMRHSPESESAQSIFRIAHNIQASAQNQDSKAGLQFFWEQVVGVA